MYENEIQEAILQTIASVPKGKVCTYGIIAKLAGAPGKARYVGYILKTLPKPTSIPWHRIINAQGKSSFPLDNPNYKIQMTKLQDEGIVVLGGRIKLKLYLWQGE